MRSLPCLPPRWQRPSPLPRRNVATRPPQPALGERWPVVFPDLPVFRAPSRMGGGNAVRFLFPPGEVKALSRFQWQGPSPLPQRYAGIRTNRGGRRPPAKRPPRRRPAGPVLCDGDCRPEWQPPSAGSAGFSSPAGGLRAVSAPCPPSDPGFEMTPRLAPMLQPMPQPALPDLAETDKAPKTVGLFFWQ